MRKGLGFGLGAILMAVALGAGPSVQAVTPQDGLVMADAIDDIISLDPAEVFEFSAAEAQAQIYDRLVTYAQSEVEAAGRSGDPRKLAEALNLLKSAKEQRKSLDEGVFSAEKGQVIGPVKTQFGYYVFEVTKVTPATQQSLEEAKTTIRETVKSQNEQKALDLRLSLISY